MKDIIIMGTGKAGFLHYNSYKKIKNMGNIFFVDILNKINNQYIECNKVYKTINDVMKANNLDKDNVIIDICTPNEEVYNIIEECKKIKINNIIVEKPFIVCKDFFKEHPEINILMVQNYLYSSITNDIKEILNSQKYKIKLVYTNFSKNRTRDSIRKRGISKSVTRNFEIEMPHQIYLINYIINNNNENKVLFSEERDFDVDGVKLSNHGYGKIIMKQDNILIVHESDLTTNSVSKEVIIVCENEIVIKAIFLIYNEKLEILKKGNLSIFQNNKLIYEKIYDTDDNMYFCLNEYYEYFNTNNMKMEYAKSIVQFSNIFNNLDRR